MNETSSRTILVVEDEAAIREVLGEFFSLLNFRGVDAENGLEGLRALEARRYLAAIADIRMPKMNGIEFLRESRIIRPELPVIIMTGFGDDETRIRAMAAGAFDFLRKPFRYRQIKELLGRIAP